MFSLFCWLVFMLGSDEEELVKYQFVGKTGIFACDDHVTFSNPSGEITLGLVSQPLGAELNGAKGAWGSWENGMIFVSAWKSLVKDGRYKNHDWVVKADADTVFFPERLQAHLDGTTVPGEVSYLQNARGGYPVIGALEVMSVGAVGVWADRADIVCQGFCEGSAEDWYIFNCMELLGVEAREDFSLLLHNQTSRGCYDPWIVAFHPYKTIQTFGRCRDER